MEKQFTKEVYNVTVNSGNYDYIVIPAWTDHKINDEEAKGNEKLILDTFNTANKTGLFPSEILEQRDELLKVCENTLHRIRWINEQLNAQGRHRYNLSENELYEAIKKATNEPAHQ